VTTSSPHIPATSASGERAAGRPFVSFTWAEGRYFDLWMVVHWLTGIVGGFSNVFFGLTTPQVFGLGSAMMVAWEVIEYAKGVRESLSNRLLDIVVGLLGTWLALAIAARLSPTGEYVAFGAALASALTGVAFGARAHRRRRSRPLGNAR
jgi:hypothetical protein